MTTHPVLIDTGPLVALFSRRDEYHEACVEQLRSLSPPLLTCWPVVTEAAWLLKENPLAVQKLLELFGSGFLKLLSVEKDAFPWILQFMQQYRELGAQLADACLMYLAERETINTIFTLDRRDFMVYRLSGKRIMQLIPEI